MRLLNLIFVISCAFALTSQEVRSKYTKGRSILKINNNNYDEIFNSEKDFYIVTLITASSANIGCILCNEVQPYFQLVADSYQTNLQKFGLKEDEPELIFAIADFSDSREFFQKLSLNNVPKVYMYKPTSKAASHNMLTSFEEFSLITGDYGTNMISWIQNFVKSKDLFEIHVPVNYTSIAITAMTSMAFFILILKKFHWVVKIITNKNLWQAIAILWIILFISGYMYNVVRGAPYMKPSRDGQPLTMENYFASGFQQQFSIETQILSLIYGLLLVFTVGLSKVGKKPSSKIQVLSTIGISLLVLAGYSGLINCFQVKSGSYPFHLLI